MTMPHSHWLWLVGAVFLFVVSLRDSIRRLVSRRSAIERFLPPQPTEIRNERKRRAFAGIKDPNEPNILCRILDAVTGPSVNAPSADYGQLLKAMISPEVEIVFKLRLMNQGDSPVTFAPTAWKIELTNGVGKSLSVGYGQFIGEMFFCKHTTSLFEQGKKERFDKDLITELSKIPMDANVPVEGWARFTISGLSSFHIFGATIKMTAVTDRNQKWTGFLKPPGTWLNPAQFSFRAD